MRVFPQVSHEGKKRRATGVVHTECRQMQFMWTMNVAILAMAATVTTATTVTLSNIDLPKDQNGEPIITVCPLLPRLTLSFSHSFAHCTIFRTRAWPCERSASSRMTAHSSESVITYHRRVKPTCCFMRARTTSTSTTVRLHSIHASSCEPSLVQPTISVSRSLASDTVPSRAGGACPGVNCCDAAAGCATCCFDNPPHPYLPGCADKNNG